MSKVIENLRDGLAELVRVTCGLGGLGVGLVAPLAIANIAYHGFSASDFPFQFLDNAQYTFHNLRETFGGREMLIMFPAELISITSGFMLGGALGHYLGEKIAGHEL